MIRLDQLHAAWVVVRRRPMPGGDGVGLRTFEAGLEGRLAALHRALLDGSYRPGPLRHVRRMKPDGGERLLSIPGLADRVAQRAVLDAVYDRVDGRLLPQVYGYRRGRSPGMAVVELLREAEAAISGRAAPSRVGLSGRRAGLGAAIVAGRRMRSPGPREPMVQTWLTRGSPHGSAAWQPGRWTLPRRLGLWEMIEALMGRPESKVKTRLTRGARVKPRRIGLWGVIGRMARPDPEEGTREVEVPPRLTQIGAEVVKVDITSLFDELPLGRLERLAWAAHPHPVWRRLASTWLRAWATSPGRGVPQGAPLSPLLANLYLDDVLDRPLEAARDGLGVLAWMRFGDDVTLVVRAGHAARALAWLDGAARRGGLRLSARKTVVAVGRLAAAVSPVVLGRVVRMG